LTKSNQPLYTKNEIEFLRGLLSPVKPFSIALHSLLGANVRYEANTLMFANMDPIGIGIAMCSFRIAYQKSDDIEHQMWSGSWNGDRREMEILKAEFPGSAGCHRRPNVGDRSSSSICTGRGTVVRIENHWVSPNHGNLHTAVISHQIS
jgi:hypothetical protein